MNELLLKHMILLVDRKKSDLRGARVLQYLKYGEKHPMGTRESSPVPTKDTVAAREREGRQWYDLTDGPRPALCWPKAHQYKHLVSRNPKRWVLNCRLYAVDPKPGVEEATLHACLLSTLTVLLKFLFGRSTGREGNLDTMVSDAQRLPVLDIRHLSEESSSKIAHAASTFLKRQTGTIPDEIDAGIRRDLDDSILQIMGAGDPVDRSRLLGLLYSALSSQLAETRRLEKIAQRNRLVSSRKTDTTSKGASRDEWEVAEETAVDLDLGDE